MELELVSPLALPLGQLCSPALLWGVHCVSMFFVPPLTGRQACEWRPGEQRCSCRALSAPTLSKRAFCSGWNVWSATCGNWALQRWLVRMRNWICNLILLILNFSNHMWLVATILNRVLNLYRSLSRNGQVSLCLFPQSYTANTAKQTQYFFVFCILNHL